MNIKRVLLVTSISFAISGAFLCFANKKKMSITERDPAAGLNGSFEHTKNGLPTNWQLYTTKTTQSGDFDIMLDKQDAKEGKQSLQFVVRDCSAIGGWRSPGFAREIDAKPGELHYVSLWVKNTGAKFRVRVCAVNNFHSADGPVTQLSENISGWRQIRYDYTIPQSMNRLRIEANVLSPGTFWVDDVRIEKKISE